MRFFRQGKALLNGLPNISMLNRGVIECLLRKPFLDLFWQDLMGFFNCLVTMDETWIHVYDQGTKEQSKDWRHGGSPCPKKFKIQ
jgi:hypothetical protein